MIINLFDKDSNKVLQTQEHKVINQTENIKKEISIEEIQKYLIDNYLDDLKQKNYSIVEEKIEKYIYDINLKLENDETKQITNYVIDKMFGYDILQKYIENENITDIRVVRYNLIYVKEKGIWKKTEDAFKNNEEFNTYLRYCILKNNANINFDSPLVTASDKEYNLRLEAGISPVNAISSSLVIRIHRHNLNITLESLFIKDKMLDSNSYTNIIAMIKNQKSIVICGKGGSGKTSLLRAIINAIPNEIAITTNEETTELYIENKNIIQREILQSREDKKKITLEDLTKHCLVMSNDVIVVGELKGSESAQFFDFIATGHQGLTTVHADSSFTAINRIISLIKRNVSFIEYKEEFIEKMIAQSLDYIIFMKNYKVNEILKISFDRLKKEVEYETIYSLSNL